MADSSEPTLVEAGEQIAAVVVVDDDVARLGRNLSWLEKLNTPWT